MIIELVHNDGNMKSWIFWNNKLSNYYKSYLKLKNLYLVLTAQFICLGVMH